MEVNHAKEVVNAIRISTPQPQPADNQAVRGKDASEKADESLGRQHAAQRVKPTSEKSIEVTTRHARYRVDRVQGEVIAFIVDENNEVVKQIPPEELRRAAQQVDRLQGLLFDQLA